MSCDNMKPYACGGSMNPNTVQNPCDRSLHFEGADDVTINQGVGIDLTEGVHAYDANGNEIEYTVEPYSIEKCEVGDHVITYTATGEGSRSVPTMCGETALYARACNIITEIKERIITILQSANPIIRGLSDALIQPDETFSPLSGVTAEDANGNELTVSYSGRYTNTAEGDIATFDTPYAEPMVSLIADIDPIQDTSGGAPSPSNICPISGWDSVDVVVSPTQDAQDGTTYTTTLHQTVYGGTLDVVSGVLTVDRAMVTFDGTNNVNPWKKSGSALNGYYTDMVANMGNWAMKWVSGIASPIITDKFKYTSSSNTYFNNYGYTYTDYTIGFNVDPAIAGNTVDSFKAWLAENPVQVVYELATPTTIQLTPTQIDSLPGLNNVWADSGDVTVWYVDEIPQSAFSYPVRGTYTITYTAEDECGNRTEEDRTIQVGAETFRTVIYEDKTLIINEKSSDMEENERLHGRAEYVYDAMDNDHPYVFSSPEDVLWGSVSGYPERVEFGSEVHPTSTAYWFYGMNQVNTFDLTNLDTSNVTDMKYMFYGCERILNLAPEFDTSNVTDMSHMFERCIATPEIDVSSFDTSNVTDMSSMFASCYNLQTIYAKPTFVTDNVTSSNLMFGYDAHLVGGNGTPYDSNYEDKTYARIDNPPDEPGYFTQG